MPAEDHLGAVFPDRASAEAAVDELRRLGLADAHLGIAVRQPDDHVFEEDPEAAVLDGIEKGIILGAPVGAVAGIALMSLLVPGAGILGVGGLLAAGGIPGAIAGTYFGALLGLSAEEHLVDEELDWERVRLEPGQVLLVVAEHAHREDVAEALRGRGGRIIHTPSHLD